MTTNKKLKKIANKKEKAKEKEPSIWDDQVEALKLLKKEYPDLPEPHLLRCWKVYKHISLNDDKDLEKQIDGAVKTNKIADFDDNDLFEGYITINDPKIEEEVLLKTEKYEPNDKKKLLEILDDEINNLS